MQFAMLAMIMLFLLYGAFGVVHQFSMSTLSADLSPEEMRLEIQELYASILMRLLAIFLLGPKKSGEEYTHDDMALFSILAPSNIEPLPL